MWDSRTVGNWFVTRADREGERLSVMKIIKLAYIAHGWHLEMYDEPLLSCKVSAWDYGPVIETLYRAFRKQKLDVTKTVRVRAPELSGRTINVLEQVWNTYSHMSDERLSSITHAPDSAWNIVSKVGLLPSVGGSLTIPDDLIKLVFKMKRLKANEFRGMAGQ